MSRMATVVAGVYSSIFLNSKVFEDVKKNEMQIVMFDHHWSESLIQIMFLGEKLALLLPWKF